MNPLTTAALLGATTLLSPALAQNDATPTKPAKAEAKQSDWDKVHHLRLPHAYADLPEQAPDLAGALLGGGGGAPKSFYDVVEQLDAAAKDADAPKTLLWDLSVTPGFNAAQHAEIARCFDRLRAAGRKTIAYVESGTMSTYRLAAHCDEILMADMGMLELGAPAMSVMFMKDAMDLLGVEMDVVRCGDFKGAVEPFMRSSMSTHLRDHYKAMLESMNTEIVEGVARGRKLTTARVRELQRERIFTARQAKELGLVDHLVPWVGAKAALARHRGDDRFSLRTAVRERKNKKDVNPLVFLGQLLNGKKSEKKTEAWGVAVLHLSGGIVDGTKSQPGSIVSGPTVRIIKDLEKNEDVSGVVVRINSPGGSATASEAILLALRDLSKAKPVVCSMGEMAASGGYYVTCFGRPILAEVGTITGSIGVFGMKPNAGALMRRVGVNMQTVGLDPSADINSLARGWEPEEKAKVQNFVNDIYDRFLGHVAGSRNMAVTDVSSIAGGRVWSGKQAVDLGLVDRIGGLEDAVAMVAQEAGISDKEFEVSHVPEPTDFMESLLGSLGGIRASLAADPIRAATVRPVIERFDGLSGALQLLQQCLDNDGRPTVMVLSPATLVIK